jgi:mediator of RNA polymerase II transcription subunit 12, fungi type
VCKYVYSLDLFRTFYSEGLIDNRTCLWWLVQTLTTCNLAQAVFTSMIADEYLDNLLVSRALAKPFVEACLCRLSEVRQSLIYRLCTQLLDRSINHQSGMDSIISNIY